MPTTFKVLNCSTFQGFHGGVQTENTIPLFFLWNMGLSCKFSLKPIQWQRFTSDLLSLSHTGSDSVTENWDMSRFAPCCFHQWYSLGHFSALPECLGITTLTPTISWHISLHQVQALRIPDTDSKPQSNVEACKGLAFPTPAVPLQLSCHCSSQLRDHLHLSCISGWMNWMNHGIRPHEKAQETSSSQTAQLLPLPSRMPEVPQVQLQPGLLGSKGRWTPSPNHNYTVYTRINIPSNETLAVQVVLECNGYWIYILWSIHIWWSIHIGVPRNCSIEWHMPLPANIHMRSPI